jgi:hypothetical protein
MSASPLPITAESRVVSIHQPHYLPWLGLIAKIACSDIFIVLDNVQFEKNGWQNRTRYSTAAGLKFLTLPVRQAGIVSKNIPIRDIELADRDATAKNWKTLSQRYGKRPGWPRIAERLKVILMNRHESLFPVCQATTELTLDIFRLKPEIILASTLSVEGAKSDRIVNLMKAVQATHYLSGPGAKEYLDPTAFERAGVGLNFQKFDHPRYTQSNDTEFIPAAFALEWFIEDPDNAAWAFHEHLRRNAEQAPRCLM